MDAFLDRVEKRIDRIPEVGCWLWTGVLNAYGYAVIVTGSRKDKTRKQEKVSRLMWRELNGDIPTGMFVCHHCDTPSCVNPHHLFMGSCKDNNMDRAKKGRTVNQNTGKTVCNSGHPLVGDNIYLYKGSRKCVECNRVSAREFSRRRRERKHG